MAAVRNGGGRVVRAIVRSAVVLAAVCCLFGSGGARASAFPGGDAAGALTIGGLNRTYHVHAPHGLDRPAGLVLNLHGAGMTGPAQAGATNYNAIADQYGFVVAYPDGVDMSWADGRGASIPDRQGVDDVGFLVALADRLRQEYGIDPGHVFAIGTSAGGFMASRLACERADVFAAVAPVAGSLAAGLPCAPSQPVSVLAVNGTADPVVPIGGGRMMGRGGPSDIVAPAAMAQRWRDINGCPPPVDEVQGSVHRLVATGCAGGSEVVFVQIDGGGHVWPGGMFAPFDTSQSSGQFFATHGR
ncbi:PHB depolymerase family esterase [Mycolicibacterium sp. ND9-15]|uniref:extracellular catalytic domain type 1 short-chain-length polyhydroxyalkanoate depolymerase n=1 Tax=Mycolicibacterium sp. ND9-15 TaxID=3042320 RepID=UPI002DD9F4AE|nr:PHB depolymerase family esterase [Mycolicibacterium sp. ND9-15]WSE57207.1 PHB depolymerase family esterase [Mycolicibacterium sp. ND9-15]